MMRISLISVSVGNYSQNLTTVFWVGTVQLKRERHRAKKKTDTQIQKERKVQFSAVIRYIKIK